MRVGVYVDGYNLYYSGRRWFGRGTPGWKWLSPRALAESVVRERRGWADARVQRVVYCTARVDAVQDPAAHAGQDVYLRAITRSGAVDHIEFGRYVARVKQVVLAAQPRKGRPRLVRPTLPLPPSGLPLSLGRDRGALQGDAKAGVGRHWWRQLGPPDFTRHQLPNPIAGLRRPAEW